MLQQSRLRALLHLARAGEEGRLRAAASAIKYIQRPSFKRNTMRCEGYADGATAARWQSGSTGVGLGEGCRTASSNTEGGNVQSAFAIVGEGDCLRRASGANLLIAEAQTRRRQPHRRTHSSQRNRLRTCAAVVQYPQ